MLRRFVFELCVLLFCAHISATGQISIRKLSLVDTGKDEMYIGVQNRLRISGLEVGDSVLFGAVCPVETDFDVVTFQPEPGRSMDTLAVRRGGKVIFARTFQTCRLSGPELSVGDYKTSWKSNSVRRSQLLNATKISVASGNYHSAFSIVSFEFAALLKGEYRQFEVSGNDELTMDQRLALAQLEPGDRIYIDAIMARGPDGTTRQLTSISLEIVE